MPGVGYFWLTRANRRVSSDTTDFQRQTNILAVAQLHPFVESIFQLLNLISQDPSRSEGLMRASMGVLGYVVSYKPNDYC